VFGKPAAATVDIYEDFQCPICLQFEQATHTTLDKDVRANLAQARFHMMSFLDSSSSGNRYSSRAANAGICASDLTVDDFIAFHNVLYGKLNGKQVQPAEGSNGRTDADLLKYAAAAGITGSAATTFDTCITSEKHKALVQAITDQASRDGVNGTPTIKVNGKKITATLAGLKKAIAAADAKGPKPDPSKTPTPSKPAPTKSAVVPSPSKGKSGAATSPSKPAASSSGN
jgi:protein-disulfide isomerase